MRRAAIVGLTLPPRLCRVCGAELCHGVQMVITASKRFLPTLACGFEHPKVTVVVGDGFEYLRTHVDAYDVIITDSSDPVGACPTENPSPVPANVV